MKGFWPAWRRKMNRSWEAALDDVAATVAWSPDGAALGVATLGGSVVCLDAETGRFVWRSSGHAGGALSLAWAHDGKVVATGGHDGEVEVVDARSGVSIWRRPAGNGWASHVAWGHGAGVLGAAVGRCVRFWSATGEPLGEASPHPSTVTSLFWHPGTGWMSSCYGGIFALEVPGGGAPKLAHKYRGSVICAEPSPEGTRVALGNQDASVRLWDRVRRLDAHLTGYSSKVSALAWADDGATLATSGGNTGVLWRCDGPGPRGTSPHKLSGHEGRITSLSFLGAGRLASVALDGKLGVWACDENNAVAWECTGAPLYALSTRGGRVAASGARGNVIVWET
jgi:WD40 repeat protein